MIRNSSPYYLLMASGSIISFISIFLYFVIVSVTFVHCQSTEENNDLQRKYLDMFDYRKRSLPSSSTNTTSNKIFIPDTSKISAACPPNAFFNDRNWKHMKAVQYLQAILMQPKSVEDLISLASILQRNKNIHPKVWKKALLGATVARADMRHFAKPALVEILPDTFVNANAIQKVLEQNTLPEYRQKCIVLDETFGEDNGKENALWYFREDLMLNSMHWYWHKAYPFDPSPVIEADRRGELFYYFHRNLIARYDTERLSLGFPRVVPLAAAKTMIVEEGYNCHLTDMVSQTPYSDRAPNTPLLDVVVPDILDNDTNQSLILRKENLVTFRSRIETAIDNRRLRDENGTIVYLNNDAGIDILENIIEPSIFSKNYDYFGMGGGLHNNGHLIIAYAPYAAEPSKNIPAGPMLDTSISCRDPSFYQWHKFIDDLFVRHQKLLPPHTTTGGDFPLTWQAATISKFKVVSVSGKKNVLKTFWSQKKFDLSRGLNLEEINITRITNPLHLCIKHLNHEEFTYEIEIAKIPITPKILDAAATATVRIHMAPRFNQTGHRFTMDEQWKLFFPMDTFSVNLNDDSILKRSSLASTLTLPFAKSYEELEKDDNTTRNRCGCGWPHHLLLPKGNETGVVFDLFAIISNGKNDKKIVTGDDGVHYECLQSPIICGLFEEKYPWKSPMGYPFDRPPPLQRLIDIRPGWWFPQYTYTKIKYIEDFVSDIPNMAVTQVTIIHENTMQSKCYPNSKHKF